tara:strand:+ start:230 stop:2899 length:2670 start_codon:yes stop_codon:yes gene_type:complete
MSKKLRKLVGKPTGRVTKAGRPVLKTPQGEERSEYSATIKLNNGKYINIPTIHNGKYYTEDELKKAVEDKRMIPTSEHDSFEEAIEAAKKRSKTLKQGGVLKAHQGTIVNGQIVYPTTSQAPADPEPSMPTEGLPNPFVTDPTTIPPKQVPPIKFDIGEPVSINPMNYPISDPRHPNYNPAMEYKPAYTQEQLEEMGMGSRPIGQMPINMMPGFGGAGVDTTEPVVDFGGGQLFTTQMPMPKKTAMPMPNVDQNKKQVEQTLLDLLKQRQMEQAQRNYMLNFDKNFTTTDQYKKLISDSEAAQKEFESTDAFKKFKSFQEQQREIYNKARTDAMKQFNTQFHGGNLFPGMGSIISKQMPFNEGGTVMEKQMEMNFGETPISQLAEGGMKDDGGEKDPVSGNDVPSGSLAKEVRDDVPAMVSEGEFIFPADVTRFIGLNKLMQLRQDAKMGLKKMEAMGQLGNPDDAELPDDIPFDAADIIIMGMDDEEDLEVDKKNEGGIIGFQEGTADAGEQANQYYNIQKEGMKQYARKYVIYRNDAGQTIKVLSTANGSPIDTVPAGYKMVIGKDGLPATELPDMPEQKKPEVEQPTVQQRDDDNDTRDPMDIIKQGRESAKITADRLGMDVDEYINLPIKTRFNLLSEELNVMRGGTLDIEKRDAILAGAEGDSIFGGSLIGGVIDMIGSVFDKDNDGSMWTSTDKDGNVRNIFGQIIQTGVDVSKMGILKDGRWTGAATTSKPKKQKFSSDGSLNQNLTTSGVKKQDEAFLKDKDFARIGRAKKQRIKGATEYDSSAKAKRIRDDNKGIAAENFRARESKGPSMGADTGSYKAPSVSKAQKQTESRIERQRDLAGSKDKTAKDVASRRGFASGTMVTTPKKKPTKGKTLVQKKS